MESYVHIHRPPVMENRRSRRHCPTCKRRTTFACFLYQWYGWDVTCLACGENWQDGEHAERPFAPGWRKANIDAAKRLLGTSQKSQGRHR